jgi:hypothetical protein
MLGAQKEKFRLVGMDHFNAMFEDAATGSWWRQSTGEAVAGPKKGSKLTELPSFQMRLGSWIRLHPNTRIMQPDSLYQKEYDDLKGYDSGLVKSSLEKRDSSSWKFKSWVIGVNIQGKTRAYDWNELVQKKLINDEIDAEPILLLVEKDGMSFHAFTRKVNGQLLQFALNGNGQLEDEQTHSLWAVDGSSTDGPLKGNKLATIQAYQEFWHSWQAFHPTTSRYEP